MKRRSSFSIDQQADAIVDALKQGNRLVVEAPTGSGKSTQIPQFILDHGLAGCGRIVVLQPRRLPARMLARWVAAQRGVPLGSEIGYRVRLDNRTSAATRITYETEGMLVRQMLSDPDLKDVSVIIFDEFHERHVHGDLMLPMAMRLQAAGRPDLKIVVMSATLGAPRIADYLDPCGHITASGRTYPVDIRYLSAPRKSHAAIWDVAARSLAEAWAERGDGDVLIFMPGAYEIRRTIEAIRSQKLPGRVTCLPLHGELSPEAQDAAVAPLEGSKVVVATNVAETSLTIDGIVLVIDGGLARKPAFDPARGINTLMIESICKASADQRAGRAGRTRPGQCIRLWTEKDHRGRAERDAPEIQRIDPSEAILLLKRLGVDDIGSLDWLDAPREDAVARARLLLQDLGALDAAERLTPVGTQLAELPLHPRHGRMLLAGAALSCVEATARIAAMSQERPILLHRQNRHVLLARERSLGDGQGSDLLLALRALDYAEQHRFAETPCRSLGIHGQAARRVAQVADQLARMIPPELPNAAKGTASDDSLRKAVLAGFSDQLACLVNRAHRRYALVHRRRGTLDRESYASNSPLLVATEIHEIGRSGGEVELRLSQATGIDLASLRAMFPEDVHHKRIARYDPASKRVVCRKEVVFRDLTLDDESGGEPTCEEAAAMLAEEVNAGRLTLKQWDHRIEQWIARVNLLAAACPELGIPAITAEARQDLVQQVCFGARGYKDIKDKPVWPAVRGWLDRSQHAAVESCAPERLRLSNGRTPRVRYEAGKPPTIAMRVQELYDVNEPLTIAMDKVRVVVEILAPNQRPVQVTDDLSSFWQNSYEQVKKDLRGRYPKHEWR